MEANCMIIEMQPLFKYFNFNVDEDSRNLNRYKVSYTFSIDLYFGLCRPFLLVTIKIDNKEML